jgi:serine/threonine protein kinase
MPVVAGQRLGPYEIQSLIGAGGMGEVYKAHDTRLDRTVALKILPSDIAGDPERGARFEREAHAIAALSHPHICTLHDIGTENGHTRRSAQRQTVWREEPARAALPGNPSGWRVRPP